MDTCRRPYCGQSREAHQHHRAGTDCQPTGCPRYLPARGRWVLAGFWCSLAAAVVAAGALVLLATGYTGPTLVWLGIGMLGLLVAGSAARGHGQDSRGGHDAR